MRKTLLVPARRRRVPRQFSWVDQRLVCERHIGRCTAEALALYLILVTVADAEGLSFYADASIAGLLGWPEAQVRAARAGLVRAGLVTFQAPLYQMLSLDSPATPPAQPASPPRGMCHRRAALTARYPAADAGGSDLLDYQTDCAIHEHHRQRVLNAAQIAEALHLDPHPVAMWLAEPRFRPRQAKAGRASLTQGGDPQQRCHPHLGAPRSTSASRRDDRDRRAELSHEGPYRVLSTARRSPSRGRRRVIFPAHFRIGFFATK